MSATPHRTATTSPIAPAPLAGPDSMEELIGDCRKMAAHWHTAPAAVPAERAAGPRGITVPDATAHVVAGMADYGD
ncbi:hypothetical protein [Streptomyces sp. NPDC020983]|uniref:hypothetical protein n=1 Tax=Streptomyces sp. NPDC020983 TaxID=3365106 RepID=UPI00379F50CC